ncbi:MAG: response regulator [Flavobacteriia bacterium]|jgi:CheY-like chemotaxis protein
MEIWLIEDNEIYRQVLSRLLEKCTPYTISREYGDKPSLENLMDDLSFRKVNPPDLILLDIYLPETDGWTILDFLNEGGLQIPVIVVSDSADLENIEKSRTYLNVFGYYVKGDFPANLFEMIREIESSGAALNQIAPTVPTKRDKFGGIH